MRRKHRALLFFSSEFKKGGYGGPLADERWDLKLFYLLDPQLTGAEGLMTMVASLEEAARRRMQRDAITTTIINLIVDIKGLERKVTIDADSGPATFFQKENLKH